MIETHFLALAQLITSGQTVEALQRFYHPNVVVTEADGTSRTGQDVNITNEQKNLQAVTAVHARLLGYAINEAASTVFAEWEFIFTNLKGQSFRLLEVSVQEWEGNLVKAERFYYKDFTSI